MKVVVVGAGSLGLGAASRLVETEGVEVVVLDARNPAFGSSGRSAGIFTRLYNDELDIALRLRTIELIEGLAETQGLALRRIGLLRLARSQADLEALTIALERQEALGVRSSRLLSPAEITEIVPVDPAGILGAAYNPEDGYLDGVELCGAMVAGIRSRGGTVRSNAEVVGADRRRGGGLRLRLADGEEVDADVVVNAAGAWADRVGELLEAEVALLNEVHEVHVLQLPKSYTGPTLPATMDYVVGAEEPGVYFRQEGADQVIAGMHTNDVTDDASASPDAIPGASEKGAEIVLERLARLVPDIEFGYRGNWTGLYPHARTQTFVIGPHPSTEGVFTLAGGGGVGVNMGPVLGEILADQIVSGGSTRFPVPSEWAPGPASSSGKKA